MTREEWVECVATMRALWPSYKPDTDAIKLTYAVIGETAQQDVLDALRAIALDGGEFAPPVGQILQRIQAKNDRANILPFASAWRLVERIIGRYHTDERGALERLEGTAPAVARWVAAFGYDQLRMEPVNDPDKGSMIRAKLERSYVQSCAEYRDERADGFSLTAGRILALGGGKPALESGVVAQALREVREGEPAA